MLHGTIVRTQREIYGGRIPSHGERWGASGTTVLEEYVGHSVNIRARSWHHRGYYIHCGCVAKEGEDTAQDHRLPVRFMEDQAHINLLLSAP